MEQNKSQESKKTFYIVLIAILVILNLFFAYNHWAARKQVKMVEAQRNELDSLYTQTIAELDQNKVQLESLMGQNAEMDSLLMLRKTELDATLKEIETLRKENKLSKGQLDELRRLIKSLKAENAKFAMQVDSLSNKVTFLTDLSDSLNTGLQTQITQNEQLLSEKVILSQKVAIGSLLKPENIVASGVRFKSNDREVATTSSKKSEKLKICFDVPENKVSDPGEKTIYLRILNPQGATVSVASEGSGMFEVAETGEQQQFTTKATFEYANQAKTICVYWSQTAAYGKGMYKVYFYQNGYMMKEAEFELK